MRTGVPNMTEDQEACLVVLSLPLAHCVSSDVTAILKSGRYSEAGGTLSHSDLRVGSDPLGLGGAQESLF